MCCWSASGVLASGGARLSQAKYFAWGQVQGLLRGCAGLSATSLRHRVVAVAKQAQDKVTVRRSNGQEETLTCLQDYQEECVAQRAKRGLIRGRAIRLWRGRLHQRRLSVRTDCAGHARHSPLGHQSVSPPPGSRCGHGA